MRTLAARYGFAVPQNHHRYTLLYQLGTEVRVLAAKNDFAVPQCEF